MVWRPIVTPIAFSLTPPLGEYCRGTGIELRTNELVLYDASSVGTILTLRSRLVTLLDANIDHVL